jgi:hypothetical protein
MIASEEKEERAQETVEVDQGAVEGCNTVIAIFGSRQIDTRRVYNILMERLKPHGEGEEYITSGNIGGAALMGVQAAKDKACKITLYNYKSGLGLYLSMRDIMGKNKKMIAACDKAYVFWNGESKGTAREIEMFKKAGKPYEVIMCGKRISGASLSARKEEEK